jgi:hypothetical protein
MREPARYECYALAYVTVREHVNGRVSLMRSMCTSLPRCTTLKPILTHDIIEASPSSHTYTACISCSHARIFSCDPGVCADTPEYRIFIQDVKNSLGEHFKLYRTGRFASGKANRVHNLFYNIMGLPEKISLQRTLEVRPTRAVLSKPRWAMPT